ncbi:hypothetical protein GCM10009560_76370 [Nonomuraea longicatena]|uniref:Major facilitator superfamily (MFS) profile domain-containing protein n=1 Tax=Nonomuraea longicatena TaxID=83682 RepID=A0ABN1R9L4_9ACTN
MHGYNLTFASFMLACGALADRIGRRRVFTGGAVLFTAASAISAAVSDILLIDLARAAAGAGAAALLTSGSAILATTFEGAARTRVFAAVGIATGGGLAMGAMAAGVLADTLGWRSFFWVHAVLMALVLLAVPFMRESRGESAAKVDWYGTATFVGALFLLMLGTAEGPRWGWSSPEVLGLLAGAAVLLAVFVAVERRQRHPTGRPARRPPGGRVPRIRGQPGRPGRRRRRGRPRRPARDAPGGAAARVHRPRRRAPHRGLAGGAVDERRDLRRAVDRRPRHAGPQGGYRFVGKPRFTPPCEGSSQREVTTLPRV